MPWNTAAFALGIGASAVYDDNVYKTQTNRVADQIATVKPRMLLGINTRYLDFGAIYDGIYAKHRVLVTENYQDHSLRAYVNLNSDFNIPIKFDMKYNRDHDIRGNPGSSLSASDFPVQQEDAEIKGEVSDIHIRDNQALDIDVVFGGRKYLTNTNQFKNDMRNVIGVYHKYDYSGKTYIKSYLQRSVTYQSPVDLKRSDFVSYVIASGMYWKTTGKTTSHVDLGVQQAYSVVTPEPYYRGLFANIEITWLRKSFSKVILTMRRQAAANPQINTTTSINNSMSLVWKHQLTNKLGFVAKTGGTYMQYISQHNDTYVNYGLGINYRVFRFLAVGTDVRMSSRSSTLGGIDYDSKIATFNIQIGR